MKHYKLTAESIINAFGVKLFRIELTVKCKWGDPGDKGGWIEKEENLYGDAWISGNARVSGDARVYGNALVSGDARVYGNARVSGDAWVYGDALVSGDARVYGNALVYGDAWEKSPLQIQGTRHFINVCKKGWLQIGCKSFEFSYWEEHFKKIGQEQGYTEEQIKEYGMYISLAIKLYTK